MSQFDHLEVLSTAKPPKLPIPQSSKPISPSLSDSFMTDNSFVLKSDQDSQKSRERNEVAEERVKKWRLTKEYGYLCDKVRE